MHSIAPPFHRTLLFFLALLVALPGCRKKDDANSVEVLYTSFGSEIGLQDNLSFTFSRPVLTADSLLGHWIAAEYLDIEPSVEGRYQWISETEVRFSPASGFLPASTYQVRIKDALIKGHPEIRRIRGERTYEVQTPELVIGEVYATWTRSAAGEIRPRITTSFNFAVPAEVVQKNLTIHLDEKPISFTLETEGSTARHTLLINEGISGDKRLNLKLMLGKIEGMNRDGMEIAAFLESRETLVISKVEGVLEGNDAAIHVYASQEVEASALKDFLVLDPSIEYTVESAWFGFKLLSPALQADQSYSLLMKKGLKGHLGGTLKKNFQSDVSFGRISPDISFDDATARYLGREGARNLSVRIVNVPVIKVQVYKVFENNLQHFLQRGKRWGSYYNYDENEGYSDYYDYEYYEISDVGQLVWEKELATESMPRSGASRLLQLDIEDKLADKEGIYVVNIQDASRYYIADAKVVSLSDLGMIAKSDIENIYVFANSIRTADVVSEAEVRLISTHNQVMATGKTNSQGIAIFRKADFTEGFEPGMVLLSKDSDFNYMMLTDSRVSNARFEVGGKYSYGNLYDIFLYAERDIYRPGETLHMAGIVRDLQWGLVGDMPVRIALKGPDGKEVHTLRRQLDAQGMFAVDFETASTSMTGTYIAEVYTGKDTYLGQKSIQVEEFMPDRIKVDLTADKEVYRQGDSIRTTITATNYFGPPAANRNYEAEITLRQEHFTAKGYENYSFHLQNGLEYFSLLQSGKTDASGIARPSFGIPAGYENYGRLKARLYATVFDETGRPVHQLLTVPVETQEVFIGLGETDRWVGLSAPVSIPLIALDSKEKVREQRADVEVIQYQWHSVLRYSGGRYRYVSEREQVTIKKETLTIRGTDTRFTFTPISSGSYEVRVSLPDADTYVEQSFYAYSFTDGSSASLEINREGNIDITFDKDQYRPGDKAVATLRLPFSGKLLLTTEREKVMSHRYVNVKDKVYQYTFTVEADMVPNTYVTATLIKPHKEGSVPLTVAHGFASYTVEPTRGKMELVITAPEKTRSRTQHVIRVKGLPGAHITVAVVDEGILALKNQATPDPYSHFYGKRALEVSSHDLYPMLFPEVTATGGGDDFASELAKRANPMKNDRVKLVSYWSGVLPANNNGEVELPIDIPGFSGSLRVMAVASKNGRFGSAEKQITVADPIVLSAAIPRFLSMGDQWNMNVSISNTTAKKITGKISVETSGPLESGTLSAGTVEVAAGAEENVTAVVTAGMDMATAKVTVKFLAAGETYYQATDITIRPAASLVKQFNSGTIGSGKPETLNFDNRFIPESEENTLFISRSPLAQFSESLDYLTGYPFGCVEQTISKAFPQLYFEDLVLGLLQDKGSAVRSNEIKRNVQAAIDKVKAMQLSNGGLTYWPTGGQETWWGSAYAAHFLLEAREMGYQVDARVVNRLLDYLRSRLRKKETEVYYYNGGEKRTIVSKETAYSLYVLAIANQPDRSTMSYYLNAPNDLSMDAKYLLACAYILTGEMDKARKLMPTSFAGEKAVPTSGGSFYSYIRDLAISTNALLEADPNHPQIPDMIRQLSAEMKRSRYLNTQERAFGFLALGKYARLQPIGKATATIEKDGKILGKFEGRDLWMRSNEFTGEVTIKPSGEGNLYYTVERSGIPLDGKVTETDNHLQVRREYFNRQQQRITDGVFDQNDLVVVRLSLRTLSGNSIENVAVTDLLPAGFEIENARIGEMPDLQWVNPSASHDYMDIRDDRIHYFTTATPQVQYFYYLARAVTPGTFRLGPVSADAMYQGEYHSYHGSGTVRVRD